MLPLIVIRSGRDELPARESVPSRVIESVWKYLAGHEVLEHGRAQLNLTAVDYWSRESVSEFARVTKHVISRFGPAGLKYAGQPELRDPPHYGWAVTADRLPSAVQLVEGVDSGDTSFRTRLTLSTSWTFRLRGMPEPPSPRPIDSDVNPLGGISTLSVSLGRESRVTLAKVVLPFSQPSEEFWRYFRTTCEVFPAVIDESHLFLLTGVDVEQRRPIYKRLVDNEAGTEE